MDNASGGHYSADGPGQLPEIVIGARHMGMRDNDFGETIS
jgi:hypothetical protein